jgi:pimeloyl-ACP methyl ester carboxylesterase
MILNIFRRRRLVACLLASSPRLARRDRTQHPPAGRFVDVTAGACMSRTRPAKRAPPIVLLHGASGNLQDMRLTLGERLAARHRVILIDRPGHGWSGRPDGDDAASARQAR